MSTKANNSEQKTGRLEALTNKIESARKIAVDIFLFLAIIVISIAMIRHSLKKQLVIYPIKVPKQFLTQGITGEILTTKLLDRIATIKTISSLYYSTNNVQVPSWENEVDEVKNALGEDTYSKINLIFNFLINKTPKKGNGEIINIKDSLQMTFRISGQTDVLSFKEKNIDSIDSLVTKAAEFIMEKSDPYYLAGWYLKTAQRNKCLHLAQIMLNDDDETNDGLAMHLRGSAYISATDTNSNHIAIEILKEAVKKIKSPWLSYNNLGVAYFNRDDSVSAAKMYQESIKSNPKTFGGYLNYGNLLYKEYVHDHKKTKQLDSAIQFYSKAISYDKNNITEYLAIIPALYARNRIDEADQYFQKVTEMDNTNFLIYFQMGLVFMQNKKYPLALAKLKQAYSLCNSRSDKDNIQNVISAIPK